MARRSKATDRFRQEINAKFPDRPTNSDGWIGDPEHQARNSDHNPNSAGVVQAEDVTLTRSQGDWTFNELRQSRDERIKYVIYNRQMFSSYPTSKYPAWTVRPYSGVNAHASHLHLSVQDSANLYDDGSSWGIADAISSKNDSMEAVLFVQKEDEGGAVKFIQLLLLEAGEKLPKYGPDGDYGQETADAVSSFWKRIHGKDYDGERITPFVLRDLFKYAFSREGSDNGVSQTEFVAHRHPEGRTGPPV